MSHSGDDYTWSAAKACCCSAGIPRGSPKVIGDVGDGTWKPSSSARNSARARRGAVLLELALKQRRRRRSEPSPRARLVLPDPSHHGKFKWPPSYNKLCKAFLKKFSGIVEEFSVLKFLQHFVILATMLSTFLRFPTFRNFLWHSWSPLRNNCKILTPFKFQTCVSFCDNGGFSMKKHKLSEILLE